MVAIDKRLACRPKRTITHAAGGRLPNHGSPQEVNAAFCKCGSNGDISTWKYCVKILQFLSIAIFLAFSPIIVKAGSRQANRLQRSWSFDHDLIGCAIVQYLPDGRNAVAESRWTGPTLIATNEMWWPHLSFGSPMGSQGIVRQHLSRSLPDIQFRYSATGCLSSDGKVFATTVVGRRLNPAICIWDVGRRRCIHRIPLHHMHTIPGLALRMALSPHGRRIVFRASKNQLEVLRTSSGRLIFNLTVPHVNDPNGVGTVCFATGNRILAITAEHLIAWGLPSGRMIFREKTPDAKQNGFLCLATMDGGRRVICSGWGGNSAVLPLWIYSTTSGKLIRAFHFANRLAQHVAIVGRKHPWIRAVGVSVSASSKTSRAVVAEELSGDVRQPFADGFGRYIVFNTKTGQVITKSGAILSELWSVSISPNGLNLLGATSGEIRLWSIDARR